MSTAPSQCDSLIRSLASPSHSSLDTKKSACSTTNAPFGRVKLPGEAPAPPPRKQEREHQAHADVDGERDGKRLAARSHDDLMPFWPLQPHKIVCPRTAAGSVIRAGEHPCARPSRPSAGLRDSLKKLQHSDSPAANLQNCLGQNFMGKLSFSKAEVFRRAATAPVSHPRTPSPPTSRTV